NYGRSKDFIFFRLVPFKLSFQVASHEQCVMKRCLRQTTERSIRIVTDYVEVLACPHVFINFHFIVLGKVEVLFVICEERIICHTRRPNNGMATDVLTTDDKILSRGRFNFFAGVHLYAELLKTFFDFRSEEHTSELQSRENLV